MSYSAWQIGLLSCDEPWECLVCGKEMPDWRPKFCCNGDMCGCGGMPLEPALCSVACANALSVRNALLGRQ